MTTALVLAGGGVAGIAWETGVLYGLADAARDVAAGILGSDVIIGTSAGAAVAAQITSGRSLGELYADQVSGPSPEIAVELDLAHLIERFGEAVSGARSPVDVRRQIGRLAAETKTVSEGERRGVIERRLPSHDWPQVALMVVAVDAETGDRVVFTQESAVPMVDAVAASCAVPGVWPPVTIGQRRFVDGGVYSASNLDLATGAERVLVLSPAAPDAPGLWGPRLVDEVAALESATVDVIAADAAATVAFGANPLAASTRRPAAEAGRRQGLEAAGRLERWRHTLRT